MPNHTLNLQDAAKLVLELLDKKEPIPEQQIEDLRNTLRACGECAEDQFDPLLKDLRAAAVFQASVDKATADGEDVMSTGVLRDALNWTDASRKQMCEWLLQEYPEAG